MIQNFKSKYITQTWNMPRIFIQAQFNVLRALKEVMKAFLAVKTMRTKLDTQWISKQAHLEKPDMYKFCCRFWNRESQDEL